MICSLDEFESQLILHRMREGNMTNQGGEDLGRQLGASRVHKSGLV